eukprot:10927019-Karenia_brevis.AAC.1
MDVISCPLLESPLNMLLALEIVINQIRGSTPMEQIVANLVKGTSTVAQKRSTPNYRLFSR